MQSTGNLIADTICRTAELGLTITGAADAGSRTIIECQALDPINACPQCRHAGVFRDHTIRTLTDLPIVGFPTTLKVRLPRYRCTNDCCDQKYFQAGLACACDHTKVTDRVTRWILQRLAIDRMSISATAKSLDIGWDLTCQLALEMCHELIYNDPQHLAGVSVIGVDEHKWSHNRRTHGDGYVTIIVDMTGHNPQESTADKAPARLLDVVPGRSATALKQWLYARGQDFRDKVKIISMDGFQGYASAADEVIPKATKVMDPFHVVRLAGDKVTKCRQRLQRETTGRRGISTDPLYRNRKSLLTRTAFLTDKQKDRLEALFTFDDDYAPLQETWKIYQQVIDCYQDGDKRRGKKNMRELITTLARYTNTGLPELAQLGRTLAKRSKDILAYFDKGVSNGPVEAINKRLEHLRGIALGFRNLTHYILRCLIHSGQLADKINAL